MVKVDAINKSSTTKVNKNLEITSNRYRHDRSCRVVGVNWKFILSILNLEPRKTRVKSTHEFSVHNDYR